jgi:hypothetical protein
MRHLSTTPYLAALYIVLLVDAVCVGQTQGQRFPAAPHSSHNRQGFVDYVLGKINPNGSDYGAAMKAGRDAVVRNTVDDLYFWSNVVTLLSLTGTAAVIFLQWRSSDKREVVAASLITELWNGRVSDRIELERRTEQFNQLVETHNAEVEKALSLKSQPPEKGRETAGNLSRNVRKLTDKGPPVHSQTAPTEPNPSGATSATGPDGTSTGLQQSNLLLQRRLEAMQNSESNLKQRLNQTTLLLDQERRRNASLKGA